jgi:hypothetical protein
MKKVISAFALAFLVTSCGVTIVPQERIVLTSFADYTKHSEEGFLISPTHYTLEYESIGELHIEVKPALIVRRQAPKYEGGLKKTIYTYEELKFSELVDLAVSQAKEKGADAIVNFSINSSDNSIYANGEIIYGRTYFIKGFCIKRK